ncbi:MAG: hypothetical protein JO289_06680 [Xanthobacteraceae bacterium]|nr:hypothetical protein [Xanthobacteraceae bacterium]
MCDYSMQHVASRPAKVGDVLMTTRFAEGLTGGFSAVGEPDIAVCVLPGTELAFEREIERYAALPLFRPRKLGAQVARFRRVHEAIPRVHHDALELPGGKTVLLTNLRPGQRARVLQLPAGSTAQVGANDSADHAFPAEV